MPGVESRIIIRSYAPTDVAEAVRVRRARKPAASEIALSGRSCELQAIFDRVELIAERMEGIHSLWIGSKIDSLSEYFSRINSFDNGSENGSKQIGDWRTAVKDAYWDGLSTTVTQEYRLSKKEIPPNSTANFEDYDYIQDLITSYTFDFYRTLKVCDRLNVAPKTALRLAKLTHRFNPNILIDITQKYPGMDAYVINRAAVHYSSNPDAFLDGVVKAINRLTQKYPGMDAYVIKIAAAKYSSNPDAFIDRVSKAIERLTEKYPGVHAYIITRAAVHYPSNPDAFIESN